MAVAVPLMIASAVIAAASTAAAAKAQADSQRYNADVAKNNATYAQQAAAENARRQQVQATQQIGQLRANIGASGLQTEGSPLDLLEQSARTSELDRLSIIHQGALQANALRNGAQLDNWGAGQSMSQGVLSASGQLLKGASSAAGAMSFGSSVPTNDFGFRMTGAGPGASTLKLVG